MKKSCEINGLTIISIQEGKELGIAKKLVIDPASGTIAALLVDDGKWYLGAKLLPFSAVSGLGEYAITINSEVDLIPVVPTSQFAPLIQQDVRVIGSLALTVTGNVVGMVSEIIINNDGKITACLIEEAKETCTVPAERVLTYGKDILIIATNADSELALEEEKMILTPPVLVEEVPIEPNLLETATHEETHQDEPVDQETDALAKMFEEKQRKYLLGKRASRRIEGESGMTIVDQGEEITEAILQTARLSGKFVELSTSIY